MLKTDKMVFFVALFSICAFVTSGWLFFKTINTTNKSSTDSVKESAECLKIYAKARACIEMGK